MKLQTQEESGFFLVTNGLHINLDKGLRMHISGSPTDFVSEIAVVESLRKDLSLVRVYKFADCVRAQAKETCVSIEDGNIMLMFEKRACIFGDSVSTLPDYD